jgi:hypothetical protein
MYSTGLLGHFLSDMGHGGEPLDVSALALRSVILMYPTVSENDVPRPELLIFGGEVSCNKTGRVGDQCSAQIMV